MKIGVFCTNNYSYPLPPKTIYASIPLASKLAEGLSKRGYDTTLFAPEGTKVECKVETFGLKPFNEVYKVYGPLASYDYEDLMISKILQIADKFDILHAHIRPLSILPWFEILNHKGLVQTVHDPLHYPTYKMLKYYDTKKVKFISITNAQRKTNEYLNWYATVYNGIEEGNWKFNDSPSDYYVWVGRIIPEKGLHNAIKIAKTLGLNLKIAGQVNELDPNSNDYFENTIKPQLSNNIEYLGILSQEEMSSLYSNAKAYLYPFDWNEPFGLTMVEAMACGTPVFTLNNGSAPEIVENSVNGYREHTLDELTQRVKEVDKINRLKCREYTLNKFSLDNMIEGYIKVYKSILKNN